MSPVPSDRSVRGLLKLGIGELRDARVPSYTLAAELLLLHVAKQNRTWIYAHPEELLTEDAAKEYFELLRKRCDGVPTQHLTGKQEFWGLEFEVTPDVLIPRPETEHIVEVALDRLAVRDVRHGHKHDHSGAGLEIIDLGTGSGCIAIALANEIPSAKIWATDLSSKALEVARRNAGRFGFASHITFLESNLFSAFSGHNNPVFDAIVSNPPYVSRREEADLAVEVRKYEPELALYGGEEGYEFYGSLVAESARYLKPGGLLVLELGYDSLPAVQPLLETPEWTRISVTNDLAGIPRVISAERT